MITINYEFFFLISYFWLWSSYFSRMIIIIIYVFIFNILFKEYSYLIFFCVNDFYSLIKSHCYSFCIAYY